MSSLGTGSTQFSFTEGGVLPVDKVTATDFGEAQRNMILNTQAGGSTNGQENALKMGGFEASNATSQMAFSKYIQGGKRRRRKTKRGGKSKKNRRRKRTYRKK